METGKTPVPDEIENCPVYRMMQLFQGKWSVWVLYELSRRETMRFGELKKAIPGISNTMLTSTLKDLQEKQLVERISFDEVPPHVEYTATERARKLRKVFESMREWSCENL